MKIDKELQDAIIKVKEVFDSLRIDSCVIGALVPHIKIALKLGISSRQTMDVDYIINVGDWKEFEEIKVLLEKKGFVRTKGPHRMKFGGHSIVDMIPYSKKIVKDGTLIWPQDNSIMNVRGFERVFKEASEEALFKGMKWRVASIPIFVLNKIMTYEDRKLGKDISDIKFCLEHYEEEANSEVRYQAMNDLHGLGWEFAGAYALGREIKGYLDDKMTKSVTNFFRRFSSFEVPTIDIILREEGRLDIEDDMRKRTFDLFKWLEKGMSEL